MGLNQQFVTLWEVLSDIHLVHEVHDNVHWKIINDGKYSSSSAYKLQLEGLISTTLNASVWKV
jgi:hypothetical protein